MMIMNDVVMCYIRATTDEAVDRQVRDYIVNQVRTNARYRSWFWQGRGSPPRGWFVSLARDDHRRREHEEFTRRLVLGYET
jgi:hypothetical protein